MPAQSGDPVSAALLRTLGPTKKCDNNFDSLMVASAKQVLSTQIKYEASKSFNTTVLSELRSKYTVLNTAVLVGSNSGPLEAPSTSSSKTSSSVLLTNLSKPGQSSSPAKMGQSTSGKIVVPSSSKGSNKHVSLPKPVKVLYPAEDVQLSWKNNVPVGSGFLNVGNTCYLNSTLQALFHVPAFSNWLVSDKNHTIKCETMNGMTHSECLICAMSKTLQTSQRFTGSAIKPIQIYSKLKSICKSLNHGHQEDAHEFLRYLLEGMEKSYLTLFNGHKLDNYSKETTPLNQIFGGYLRTEVTCLECDHVSTTFQHFQDIILDIRQVSSVEDALDAYFSRESIGDGEQTYKCEQCLRKVAATKKFSIERPPKALCIQLKRFSSLGSKNSKHIHLKQYLDLSRFRHKGPPDRPNQNMRYKLVSLVTHIGSSANYGHYTASGLSSTGSYYLFDDSIVKPITIQNVLNSNAYIIMYELDITDSLNKPMDRTPNKVLGQTNGHSNGVDVNKQNVSKINSNNGEVRRQELIGPVMLKPKVEFPMVEPSKPIPLPEPPPAQINRITAEKKEPEAKKEEATVNNAVKNNGLVTTTGVKKEVTDREVSSPVRGGGDSSEGEGTPGTSSRRLVPYLTESSSNTDSEEDSSDSEEEETKLTRQTESKPNPNNTSVSTPTKMNGGGITSGGGQRKLCPVVTSPRKDSPAPPPPPPPPPSSSSASVSASSSSSPPQSPVKRPPSPRSLTKKHLKLPYKEPPSPSKQVKPKTLNNHVNNNGSSKSDDKIGSWEVVTVARNSQPSSASPATVNVASNSSGRWNVTSSDSELSSDLPNGSSNNRDRSNDRNKHSNGSSSSSSSTVQKLMEMSHRGYSNNVSTWNGGRSEVDKEVNQERLSLKRPHSSSYDDDLDRGKVKKRKKGDYESKDERRYQEFRFNRKKWRRWGNGGGGGGNSSANSRHGFYRQYTYERSRGHSSSYYQDRWHH